MEDVFFGLGIYYDSGIQTSVAINANGVVVEVHKSHVSDKLWYHVGNASKLITVEWGGST